MGMVASPRVLELATERFECWNRDELDQMLEMYAPDAVFDVSAVFTDVAPKRGHAEMLEYWRELQQTWSGIRMEPIEAFELGSDRVIIDIRLVGRGQQSGAEVGQRLAMLYTLRPEDQKVLDARLFSDVAAAEAAAVTSA